MSDSIIEQVPDLSNNIHFDNQLKYIANGFKISRYDYENDDTYYILSGFIYKFIEVLEGTVEEYNTEL